MGKKIVASGDWHLDRATAGFDRFDDVRSAIVNTGDVAANEGAHLYVFLGDLSNPNNVRSHRAVATAIEFARLLRSYGVESLWIQGNHDVIDDGNVDANGNNYSTLSPLAAAGFKVVSSPEVVNMAGLEILALPYPSSQQAYDPVKIVNEVGGSVKLVVGHLSMTGAALGSESVELARGRQFEWPTAAISAKLPTAVGIGGHYHRAQMCNGVVFAGSLVRLAFDEEFNTPSFLTLEL